MWQLYVGLSTDPTTIRCLVRRFYAAYNLQPPFNPFERIILSPFVVPNATMRLIALWRQGHSPVQFPVKPPTSVILDSGGYQVQTGRLTFDDLCAKLREIYNQHSFADFFVLPDFPPLSSDSDAEIERKIRLTVHAGEKALSWLPDKSKAIGVVHGRSPSQIRSAIRHYANLGISYVAFGSFATSGKDFSVNLLSGKAIALLKILQSEAISFGLKVHIFGIGNPANLIRLALAGIKPTSVDTSAWFKAGGFGAAFLPLFRQAHMSLRQAKGWRLTDTDDFQRICQLVGHSCPFCQNPLDLQRSRLARILHNLTVTCETAIALHLGGQKL
jgi:hypothetical protein